MRNSPTSRPEFGVLESCLRRWLDQDDVDGGRKEGLTTSERDDLSRLRREVRALCAEREVLKKAAAFFIKESETL